MLIKRTLSAITLLTSLTLSTSTYTLASNADAFGAGAAPRDDVPAAAAVRHAAPDYAALEAAFPEIFRGFMATDFPLIEKYRDCKNGFARDPELLPKFTALRDAIAALEHPALAPLQGEVAKVIADDAQQTVMHYVALLAKTALSLSTHTEQEEAFFRGVDFSKPYDFIKKAEIDDTLWDSIAKWMNKKNFDTRGDYCETTHTSFFDPMDVMDDMLNAGPFSSAPYFMLCTEPGADIFGLYYLAMMYYRGIHPIPVTTAGEADELHGIEMSEWGKFCHDLAHSKIDKSNRSVKQFANNILNAYTDKLRASLSSLTLPERQQYAVNAMILPVTQFALAVHNAYHQSLVEILEASLVAMGITPVIDALPPEFKAFATGAFVHAHENPGPDDLSASYATPSLRALLEKSTKNAGADKSDTPEEGASADDGSASASASATTEAPSPSAADGKAEEEAPETQGKDLFQTSFVTGVSSLTDEEIFNIVKTQPLSAYQHQYHIYNADTPLKEEEIVDYKVTRNEFYIEVLVTLFEGTQHTYRAATNHSRLLNSDHDRSILDAAAQSLHEKHGYVLPNVPQHDDFIEESAYIDAARTFRKTLDKGRTLLLGDFLETATGIADDNGISDRFAAIYTEALAELATHMPAFIGDDLQTFLTEAMPKSAPELAIMKELASISIAAKEADQAEAGRVAAQAADDQLLTHEEVIVLADTLLEVAQDVEVIEGLTDHGVTVADPADIQNAQVGADTKAEAGKAAQAYLQASDEFREAVEKRRQAEEEARQAGGKFRQAGGKFRQAVENRREAEADRVAAQAADDQARADASSAT